MSSPESPTAIYSPEERLTLLLHALRSALVADGTPVTVYERLEHLGVPLDVLLEGAQTMSAPPYSPERLNVLLAAFRSPDV